MNNMFIYFYIYGYELEDNSIYMNIYISYIKMKMFMK